MSSPIGMRIDKIRAPVVVTMADGSELRGDIYLANNTPRGGSQAPIDVFSSGVKFVPLMPAAADNVLLLNVDAVSSVLIEVAEPSWSDSQDFLPRNRVAVVMSDGREIEGLLPLDYPSESPRVSDVANNLAAFFQVETAQGNVIIGTRHIRSIQDRGAETLE